MNELIDLPMGGLIDFTDSINDRLMHWLIGRWFNWFIVEVSDWPIDGYIDRLTDWVLVVWFIYYWWIAW